MSLGIGFPLISFLIEYEQLSLPLVPLEKPHLNNLLPSRYERNSAESNQSSCVLPFDVLLNTS